MHLPLRRAGLLRSLRNVTIRFVDLRHAISYIQLVLQMETLFLNDFIELHIILLDCATVSRQKSELSPSTRGN